MLAFPLVDVSDMQGNLNNMLSQKFAGQPNTLNGRSPLKRTNTTPIKQGSSPPPAPRSPTESTVSSESFVQRFVPDMVVERLFQGGAIKAQELSRVSLLLLAYRVD